MFLRKSFNLCPGAATTNRQFDELIRVRTHAADELVGLAEAQGLKTGA